MRLSITQKAMLVRMLGFWSWPKDGRLAHGWGQTLASLRKKGFVKWLAQGEEIEVNGKEYTGPGWILTEEGEAEARGLHTQVHGGQAPKVKRSLMKG